MYEKKCSSIKFYHVWTCVCDWWDELCWTNVCACNLLFISKSVKYQGFPTPEPQLIFDILMIVFALIYFWHQDRVEYLFSINLHIPHPYLSHSFARHFWLAFHFNRESINKLKTCDNLKNVTSATSKCALQTNLMLFQKWNKVKYIPYRFIVSLIVDRVNCILSKPNKK